MKNLNKIILDKIINKNITVLIIFWIEFCIPCKIVKNNFKELKNLFKNKIKILEININYNKYIVEKFSINSSPTIIIIKNKKIIIKEKGIINKNSIKLIIKKILI